MSREWHTLAMDKNSRRDGEGKNRGTVLSARRSLVSCTLKFRPGLFFSGNGRGFVSVRLWNE